MEKRVGFVGVVIENREKNADMVNKILSDYGEIIVARVGIPYKQKNVSVITLVVDTDSNMVGALTGKLGAISGVNVKSALCKR